MTNLEKASFDPASVYQRPNDVLSDQSITNEQKVKILQQWAYDEREKAVAEEENMSSATDSDKNNKLEEILDCLLQLGIDSQHSAPTKQG